MEAGDLSWALLDSSSLLQGGKVCSGAQGPAPRLAPALPLARAPWHHPHRLPHLQDDLWL